LTIADKEAAKKKLFEEGIPKYLGFFQNVLTSNHGGDGFVVGDSLTAADLGLWLALENIEDQGWYAFENHPVLKAFKHRIESRPHIAAYRSSPKRYPLQKLT